MTASTATTRGGYARVLQAAPTTFAAIGDSILHADRGGGVVSGNSFYDYTTLMSGGRLIGVGEYGIPGQRADQVLARLPQALIKKPGFLAVEAGVNDVAQGVSAGLSNDQITATVANELTRIYDAIRAAGSQPVATTLTPYGYLSGESSRQHSAREQVNDWIRRHAAIDGLPLADFYAVLVDPGAVGGATTTAAGNWKYNSVNYTLDGTHPTPLGGGIMGQTMFAAISPFLPPSSLLGPLPSLVDTAQAYALVSNPLYNNQVTHAAVFPDLADAFGAPVSNSTGVTYSMVTDTALPGFAVQVAYSTSATQQGGVSTRIAAKAIAGHVYGFSGFFSTDGGAGTLVQATIGGTTFNLVNIAAKTAIIKGAFYAEVIAPAAGTLGLVTTGLTPVASTAATYKFWYPKVVDLTARFGVTNPVTPN